MALTAIAAVASTAAVAAEIVTVGTLMAIGTAATVVGVITKSKELVKIGGAMALVGGVGGIVEGMAASASSATSAAAEGAFEAGFVGSEAGVTGNVGELMASMEAAAPVAETTGLVGNEIAAGQAIAGFDPVPVAAPQAAPLPAPPIAEAPKPFTSTPTVAQPTQAAQSSFDAAAGASTPVTPYDTSGSWSDAAFSRSPAGNGLDYGGYWNTSFDPPSKFMGKLNGVVDWIERNKMTAYLGSQMVAGAVQSRDADKRTAIERERVAIDRDRQYNRSKTTLQRPVGLVNAQRA